MASLIESLVAAPTVRQDDKRMEVTRRPPPMRLREVLEVFGAMGNTATFEGVHRSLELRGADMRMLTGAVLGRWPSSEELAAVDEKYRHWRYLRGLLLSQEFRGPFVRRIFDAFAEKRRLLHVRIPSCAGGHVTRLLTMAGPMLPVDVGSKAYADQDALGPLFGRIFSRINTARGIGLTLPVMAPFIDPPQIGRRGADPLGWGLDQAPFRPTDLLFAIVRPPVELALSQVNGTLTLLRAQPDAPGLDAIRARLGKLPGAARDGQWKRLAVQLLHEALPLNPVCSALADGTFDGALAACARVPVELVSLAGYQEWVRPAIDSSPVDKIGVSEPFLQEADLTAQDKAAIAGSMGEDMQFHERFAARLATSGLPMVRGPEL